MKKILLLLLAVSAFGCSKQDDEIPAMPGNSTGTDLNLTFPPETAKVDPCSINFTWESSMTGTFRFLLARDEAFTHLLADTTVTARNFNYLNKLAPNTKYFWRVTNGQVQKNSSFFVKDLLAGFTGKPQAARIRRYDWDDINGIIADTTFQDSIRLTKVGDKVKLEYPKDKISKTMELWPDTSRNSILYLFPLSPGTNCLLRIYCLNDSILISNNDGGHGFVTRWIINTKK